MKDNSEQELAIKMANRALDIPFIDPDGDLCTISRQFLRAVERESNLKSIIAEQAKEIERLTEAYRSMGDEWDKTEEELEELKKTVKKI